MKGCAVWTIISVELCGIVGGGFAILVEKG